MAEQLTRDEFTDYMEAFEQRLVARLARADRRLDGIEGRLDELDGRFDTLEIRQDTLGGKAFGASHGTARDQAGHEIATRALEPVDRLSAQVERCARLLDDLEELLSLGRASGFEVPRALAAAPDTRDERMSYSEAGIDLPPDAFVGPNDESVAVPGKEVARGRRIKKANGTRAAAGVSGSVLRNETRPETGPRASGPTVSAAATRRRRRTRRR